MCPGTRLICMQIGNHATQSVLAATVHLPTPPDLPTWATRAIWMLSSSHCWGWTLSQRISWTTGLWRAYTVNHCAGIQVCSNVEDCESLWLFGCRSSVAEHWQLQPGVRSLIPGNCRPFHFHYFCLITSKSFYFNVRQDVWSFISVELWPVIP